MGRGKFRVKEINNSGHFEGNNLQDLLVDKEEIEDAESGSELDESEESDEEAP